MQRAPFRHRHWIERAYITAAQRRPQIMRTAGSKARTRWAVSRLRRIAKLRLYTSRRRARSGGARPIGPGKISLIAKSGMAHPGPPPRGEGRGPTSQIHSRGAEQSEDEWPLSHLQQRALVQNLSPTPL